jgi:hypothetical protein
VGEPTTGEKPFEQADFVVVTALEREAQAVVARLAGCRVVRLQERDVRTYHCGWVPIASAQDVTPAG